MSSARNVARRPVARQSPLTTRGVRALLGVVLAATTVSCSADVRRFPLAPPLWHDPDTHHVTRRPADFYSGLYADAVDKTLLRPLARLFAFADPGESRNVNSLDEVPNSSWFTNRVGLFPMTPAEVARGSCRGKPLDPSRGPWLVTGAKTEGVTPGFFIKAPDGERYLLKFDTSYRPQRATAADVIGSKLYHAIGYFAPCNQIVYLRRRLLVIAEDATTVDALGRKQKLGAAAVREVLATAFRLKDGRLRAAASRFVHGKPIGPFPLTGVRADDPNDVIPHEDRRELRAHRLLAAWLHHFDIREQNSLDFWVEEGGRRFVRHYQLDFGDSFGTPWTSEALNRRVGHSHFLDLEHIAVDTFTLGIVNRPWYGARVNPEAEIFGHYRARGFVASRWRAIYPNPAFSRMTRRDALWMVRIIARLSDAHLAAAVKTGRLTQPRMERYLLRTLIARRDRLLREYLDHHVPLAGFRLVRRRPGKLAQSLCFEDLALRHVGPPGARRRVLYKIRFFGGEQLERQLGWLQFQPDPAHPARSCVLLPVGDTRPAEIAPRGARDDHPLRYGVVRIGVLRLPDPQPAMIEVHLYDLGRRRGFAIVGIRRPGRAPAPRR